MGSGFTFDPFKLNVLIPTLALCNACYNITLLYGTINSGIIKHSTRYFLDRLDEIVAPDYLPKNEDILHTRVKTEKAYHHIFYPSEDKDMSMALIDVGGQRELR